jgi:hypothetical protein
MNNLELLNKHLNQNNSKPHYLSGYFGFSFDEYFPNGIMGNRGFKLIYLSPNNIKTLKKEFERISENLNDNGPLVTKHLNIIDRILINKDEDLENISNIEREEKENRYTHNKAFKKAFIDYLENGVEIDFGQSAFSEFELYGAYYGLELAKYKSFLLDSLEPKPKKPEKNEISLPQQILTLEYLGVIEYLRGKLKTEKALHDMISIFTGMSTENIKKQLNSKISDRIKKPSNRVYLNKLKQKFEKMELTKEVNQIKKDLDK